MKKKIIAVLVAALALCVVAGALTGCGKVNTTDPDGKNFVFKVGFDAGYPPYGYEGDDGEYTGVDLELAKAVCDLYGWEFDCEPIDWDAKDALVESEEITCIWNGFTYEGREADYAWTGLYMRNAQVVVTRADSGIATTADLAGKIVATQVESAGLDVLESDEYAALTATFKDLQQLDKYDNAFMQLESGAVDAVVCDLSISAYHLAKTPGVFAQIAELSSEHYAVGFKLGNEALAAKVTAALLALDANGTVKQICEKYADAGISYTNWVLEEDVAATVTEVADAVSSAVKEATK